MAAKVEKKTQKFARFRIKLYFCMHKTDTNNNHHEQAKKIHSARKRNPHTVV